MDVFGSDTVTWADLVGGALEGWASSRRGGMYAGPAPIVRGVHVTPETGLAVPAALACVRARAETLASLPKRIFRASGSRRERVEAHPLAELFEKPNPEIDGFSFWSALWHHRIAWGDAMAEIEYGPDARPVALWPLPPNVTERRLVNNNERETVYVTTVNGRRVGLPRYRVLHIPGFGFDGRRGYSPIELARRSFEGALGAAEYGARFYNQAGRPSMVVSTDKHIPTKAREELRTELEILYGGLQNAHRIALLDQGLKPETLSISQSDAQWIEGRQFGAEEVCMILDVPPFVVQMYKEAHFNAVEHAQLTWATGPVRRDATALESAVNAHEGLFLGRERDDGYYLSCVLEALLRGDTESRWKGFSAALAAGAMTPNRIAEIEDLPPVPASEGGERHYLNATLVPLETAGASRIVLPGGGSPGAHLPDLRSYLRAELHDLLLQVLGAEKEGST